MTEWSEDCLDLSIDVLAVGGVPEARTEVSVPVEAAHLLGNAAVGGKPVNEETKVAEVDESLAQPCGCESCSDGERLPARKR